MGFLDSAESLLSRGVANAGRSTKAISLKAQIADLNRSRTSLMAQLGESLFEPTRTLDEFRASHETLYVSIEELDVQRAALQSELDAIERQANLATAPSSALRCPKCGRGLSQDDAFCPGCGTNVEEARSNMPRCASCGATLGPDDAFCMNCGTPVAQHSAESMIDNGDAAAVEPVSELPVEQPVELASEPPIEPVSEHPVEPEAEHFAKKTVEPGLSVELTDDQPPEPTDDPAPLQENIKVCPSCGYHANISAAFCRNCGSRL